MGNGVVSRSRSHPTAYVPDIRTLPHFTTNLNMIIVKKGEQNPTTDFTHP